MCSCREPSTQTHAQGPQGLGIRSQDPENERPRCCLTHGSFWQSWPEGRGGGQLLFGFVPPEGELDRREHVPQGGGPLQIQGRAGRRAHVMLKGILTPWGGGEGSA